MRDRPRFVTTRSRYPFDETVERLQTEIGRAGNVLFATIDQSAAALAVGLSLRPTTLLLFGNPKGGSLLMEGEPAIGVQLPLKLVVWESALGVFVTRDRMAVVAPEYGVAAEHPLVAAMDHTLDALVDSIGEPG
jgi:uncharacterized protein (DUF302 family)